MRCLRLTGVALLVAFSTSVASAGIFAKKAGCDSNGACDTCDDCCDKIICPQPCGYCIAEAKCVDVKRTCFNVKCKTICIPAVTLPWEKSGNSCGANCCDTCDNGAAGGCNACASTKCGRVISVKVLEKSSRVVGQKIVCNWKHVKCHNCSDCPCDSDCAPAGGGEEKTDPPVSEPPPVPPPVSAARVYLPSRILRVSHQVQR